MQITLPVDLEKIVQRKVESRLYKSPDAVIRAALEVLVEYDREDETKLKWLQNAVQEANDDIERGDVEVFTSMEELMKDDNQG